MEHRFHSRTTVDSVMNKFHKVLQLPTSPLKGVDRSSRQSSSDVHCHVITLALEQNEMKSDTRSPFDLRLHKLHHKAPHSVALLLIRLLQFMDNTLSMSWLTTTSSIYKRFMDTSPPLSSGFRANWSSFMKITSLRIRFFHSLAIFVTHGLMVCRQLK